ncbi:peptidase U32 [Candidatus Falkowbacteria bacterium HGW-Falkowbacteria-2]|uniref:Peptidase U32 n=1 Tax=Candidatus Falkowbacteria bacterium HGW-Falkowbacteria-2 TaxID=2013769 RepID=A0A2N2E398_9BACT|nr:MAG: peptidase U32 [Candidatus Falkowbacteria bacterium HGW-Falkowbacteria-2]
MMNKTKPELLAPAGNLDKLKTAIAHGADAVYFGLPDFSLRLRVNDFSLSDIKKGIEFAHAAGKKAYVTLNIFARDKHLKKLRAHVLKLKEYGPDAIFISDPGIVAVVKEVWPTAKLSLSTQANCTNLEAVRFWGKQGFKRIILSRELSLKEITDIKKNAGKTEIEVFVHGALCAAYSGRCFLSDYFVGRSANLGDCSQPCRWEYEIKPKGHDKSLVIGEDMHGSYLMNSKDLCLIERLPEIIGSGIDALKIEGRAKSVYYLANVVGVYRRAIDLIYSGKSKKAVASELAFLRAELFEKLNNRGYTEGFMFPEGKDLQNYSGNNMLSPWEFCGQVISSTKTASGFELKVKAHNTIMSSSEIEIIGPSYQKASIDGKSMRDAKTKEPLIEAHGGGGGQVILIDSPIDWPTLSVLRRRL